MKEHLKRKGLTQAKTQFGVAIVRNRVVYDIKEKSNIKMILYLQDNRLDLKKLNNDINNVTYDNYDISILYANGIDKISGFEKLKTNIKVKDIKEIENNQIIKEINKIIRQSEHKQIIIAKDIQDIKTPDFIEQLLGFIQRGDVGVISPRIIYKYTSSQYNGTVYGIDKEKIGYLDYIDVAGSFGYITRGAVIQNYSIIKSECIMVSREDIENVNYLDETMDYEDAIADLSFELNKKHKKLNVINPHIELETLEKTNKTGKNNFFKKWNKELSIPDQIITLI